MTAETKKEGLSFDPGSLMVAMYILGVSVLVLLGWFGAAGAGGGEEAAVPSLIEQLRQ